MATYFDEQRWRNAFHHENWYQLLAEDYRRLLKQAVESDAAVAEMIKEETYHVLERHLADGTIALGAREPNWDAERKPIDTIVIHHTKNAPGMTWQRLSAMHLIRLYAAYYASPSDPHDAKIKGTAIFSHHFRGNTQVFYAYHWLVRTDGSVERLLNDQETGWHAGNWNVNCRSVAICLDNDLENESPTNDVLSAIAQLIRQHYPNVPIENIVGHREVNPKTTCPGNQFLLSWKQSLLALLQ